MPEVAIVLLAAGESRRLGEPKQLLELDGVPLLRRAAQAALSSGCRPVVVVTGASAEAVGSVVADLPVRRVHNPDWQGGMGTSIHAGILALDDPGIGAAILALSDQPRVGAGTYERLVRLHREDGQPVVAAEYAGTLGVPALFARSLFPDLLALGPDKGCKGLILRQAPERLGRLACPEAEIDIDTPEDWNRLSGGRK